MRDVIDDGSTGLLELVWGASGESRHGPSGGSGGAYKLTNLHPKRERDA